MTTSPSEPVDNAQPQDSGDDDQVSSEPGVIDNEQLPEDLRPTEDNPLARNPEQEGDDAAIGQKAPEGEPDASSPAS